MPFKKQPGVYIWRHAKTDYTRVRLLFTGTKSLPKASSDEYSELLDLLESSIDESHRSSFTIYRHYVAVTIKWPSGVSPLEFNHLVKLMVNDSLEAMQQHFGSELYVHGELQTMMQFNHLNEQHSGILGKRWKLGKQ